MDCRKARYFLVASFDEPLCEADSKDLSYHLKDCRDCRHESFYYRELFSAEKQLSVRLPATDFNDRLLSEIRLRDARAAWPVVRTRPRTFRWSLVYVPALFGAAAAFSFFAFLPDQSAVTSGLEAFAAQGVHANEPPLAVDPSPSAAVADALRPRYVLTPRREKAAQRLTGVIFEWPLSDEDLARAGNPFLSQLVSQSSPMQQVRARTLERYVLPVVSQTTERDRIY